MTTTMKTISTKSQNRPGGVLRWMMTAAARTSAMARAFTSGRNSSTSGSRFSMTPRAYHALQARTPRDRRLRNARAELNRGALRIDSMKITKIARLIQDIRGQRVILDKDLAVLYEVSTKNLNKAVSRNAERFPAD